jgi:hypothetical protein
VSAHRTPGPTRDRATRAGPTTGRLAEVTWEGFFNARDLGGLPTRDARVTHRGALIRSAAPRFVTEAGWRAAHDAGVRTVIDLRCGGFTEVLHLVRVGAAQP